LLPPAAIKKPTEDISTKNLEQIGAARKHETELLAAGGIEHSCFGGQLNQFDGDSRSDWNPVSRRLKSGAEPNQTGGGIAESEMTNNELLNPSPRRNENRWQTPWARTETGD
jgi:hypothetical protein